MRRGRHWLGAGCCGAGLLLVVHAEVAEVSPPGEPPPHVFLARNPFALKPIPPANPAPTAPTNPLVKLDLKLAGITVDASGKRAWLVQPASPARGATPAVTNQTYFAIAEGGRQGDVEVLAIDPKANTVRILNAGTEATLDFANNGLAAPPSTAAGHGGVPGGPRVLPRPGALGGATPIPAAPGFNPGYKPAAMNPPAAMPSPGSFGGGPATASVPAAGPMDSPTAARGLPARNVRTTPEAPVATDPVTQAILIQAQQAHAQAAGLNLPPIP